MDRLYTSNCLKLCFAAHSEGNPCSVSGLQCWLLSSLSTIRFLSICMCVCRRHLHFYRRCISAVCSRIMVPQCFCSSCSPHEWQRVLPRHIPYIECLSQAVTFELPEDCPSCRWYWQYFLRWDWWGRQCLSNDVDLDCTPLLVGRLCIFL